MRKKKLKIFIPIIVILVLILGFTVLISPVKSISTKKPSNVKGGLMEILSPSNIEFNYKNSELNVDFLLSSQDITNIVYSTFKSRINIDAIESYINGDRISVYINSKILNIFKVQYSISLRVSSDKDNLIFTILDAKVGRVPIPRSIIMSKVSEKLKSDYAAVKENSIYVDENMVKPFKYGGVKNVDGKIVLNVNYSIKTLNDIVKLVTSGIPDSIKNYVKSNIR